MKELSIGIIGGGIGGVTAAVALRHFGFDAVVYERAETLREHGAGMMLWANSTRVIKELGLLDQILEKSGPTERFLVRNVSGETLMSIATGIDDVPSVCIPRAQYLAILAATLPSEKIRTGREFSSMEHLPDGAVVEFADGETVRHDLVIGADGLRSKVRAEMFGHVQPVYRGYTIWRGIGFDTDGVMPPATSSETWGRGQRFGILCTGKGRFTWYASVNRPPERTDVPGTGRREEVLRMFEGWHAPIASLVGSTPEELVLKNAARDHRPMSRWVRGRAALLGDAAHACTPNLGQGGGMAIEDAMVLAKSLAAEATLADALRVYERRRTKRTRHIQQRSNLMGTIAQFENPLAARGRDFITNLLPGKLFEMNLRRTYSYKT